MAAELSPPVNSTARPATGSDVREFDGVVCFGGSDWWYHNRGHFDLQMMRELRRYVPVLYVNSLGVRVPRPAEGRMFFRRAARKLRSLMRGFRRVDPDFGVLSPVAVPGRLGMRCSRYILPMQIRIAASRMGITRPLVWIECPPGIEVAERLERVACVHQRTDRWEAFPGADPAQMLEYNRRIRAIADLVLYSSRHLYESERAGCAAARYVDHGVDFADFARAGDERDAEPDDVRAIVRPRVGFVGGIDAHTFDATLFVDVAKRLPEVQFVLVGTVALAEGWCRLPNVHLLGQRPYQDVARYMAACDVLIMPWNDNEWIRACNPVKLKEYLAVGRPVVSTDFPELRMYDGVVRIGRGADQFASEIRHALASGSDVDAARALVQPHTWTARAEQVLEELAKRGVRPKGRSERAMQP